MLLPTEKTERVFEALVIVIGGIALASYLGLAVVHAGTLYDINQTSGAWLSFAYYVGHGVLYPPVAEGGFYAGTRYMPGFFSLHALVAQATGEYLVSGKLLTSLSTLAIVAALAILFTRKLGRPLLAVGIASVLLATFVGHRGSLTIRSDVLPLALSLLALLILDRASAEGRVPSYRLLLASAALAGLAPLAKFTSFHALAAGFLCLAQRDRKRAFAYGAAGASLFAGGVLLANLLSHGRFFDSFSVSALASGPNSRGLGEALATYFYYLKADRAFFLLFLVALPALGKIERPFSLWKIYFLLQLFISVGFYLDSGAEYNHLIDLLAATLILISTHLETESPARRIAALGAIAAAGAFGLAIQHRDAWQAPERGVDGRSFVERELGLKGKSFLTQDPTVAVLLGQRPIVADDFQFRVLLAKGIVPDTELSGRVTAKEFDRIVLLNGPTENTEELSRNAWELGSSVAHAIRETYELEKQVGRYWVYRPRKDSRRS